MATNFPGSVDSFTNPTSGDTLDSPSHAAQHANINDAVEAIETHLLDGYLYRQTVYFTSSGTFTKATYPWLRAVRVRLVGGGGGGGGCEGSITGDSTSTCKGGNGGGAGYAEALVLASSLSASETVTVGAGGAGGAGGINNGTDGGTSSFGAHCSATGGGGGAGGARATYPIDVYNGTYGTGTAGDIQIAGNQGPTTLAIQAAIGSSYTGWSEFGAGKLAPAATNTSGSNGLGYGSGATGASSHAQNVARSGGAGSPGLIILELFA